MYAALFSTIDSEIVNSHTKRHNIICKNDPKKRKTS